MSKVEAKSCCLPPKASFRRTRVHRSCLSSSTTLTFLFATLSMVPCRLEPMRLRSSVGTADDNARKMKDVLCGQCRHSYCSCSGIVTASHRQMYGHGGNLAEYLRKKGGRCAVLRRRYVLGQTVCSLPIFSRRRPLLFYDPNAFLPEAETEQSGFNM